MPLEQGTGKDVISRNIQKLVSEGYPNRQAAAIAYSTARKSKQKQSREKSKTGGFYHE